MGDNGGLDLWGGEQTVLCRDERLGLYGVIVIDDTTLGPGLGGIRLKRYDSDSDGVRECRRLAAAMSRKNALAGLPYGGAKSVIFDVGPIGDRAALMRRFGEFVARTNGSYIPGVDMGTTVEDLALVGESGCEVSCSNTDPSTWTAAGVWAAMRATVRHVDGRASLEGVRVLVQGAGHVGRALASELSRDGAIVLICDTDRERARTVADAIDGADVVEPDRVMETPCDVFSPCAAAGVLDADMIARLECRMVVGAANDTLADDAAAPRMHERSIAYVPDYVANAGGVIQIHGEQRGWTEDRIAGEVLAIGDRVGELLSEARALDMTPLAVAERRALELLGAPSSALAAVGR